MQKAAVSEFLSEAAVVFYLAASATSRLRLRFARL